MGVGVDGGQDMISTHTLKKDRFCSHFLHVHVLHFIQAVTTLHLYRNTINAEGAQYLASALKKNTMRKTISSATSFIIIFFIKHRHSQHSILKETISTLKEQSICKMYSQLIVEKFFSESIMLICCK
jgi:hypothetical protein